MPGLSLIIASALDQQVLSGAIADLQSDYSSPAELLYKDNRFAVVFSGHKSYPKWFYEDDENVVLFEGMVYNRPVQETTEKISTIAGAFSNDRNVEEDIRDFVNDSDGDYLCAVYSKRSSSLLIFNDHFGRLPSFYYEGSGMFALSREIKFLLHFMPAIAIDRFSLAQFLMFEHTLGDKTLFQNLFRVLPSRIIQTRLETTPSPDRMRVTHCQSLPLKFVGTERFPPRDRCNERVASCFMESIENRYSTCRKQAYSCIADVSGGYDTRAVIMGMEKLGADVDYFTHRLVTGDESRVAQMLGDVYEKPVQVVSASHELDYAEMEKLVYETDCMVNGWTALMSWRDSSEKKLMVEEKTACFMGFNGEFTRHPFLPARGHHSLQSMLRANVLRTPLSSRWASILAGIPCEAFIESMETYFEGYNETTFEGKLKHIYFEYKNLVNAGEDRIRRLFWTVQPFWGKNLFEFEIREIPLEYAGYSLYTAFLRAIDPKALRVPVHGSRIHLDSYLSVRLFDVFMNMRYHVRNYVLSNRFTNKLYARLKGRERNSPAYKDAAALIERIHQSLDCLKECVEKNNIERFINHGYGMTNLYRLLSVLMYFKQLEERFADKLYVE